MLEIFGELVQVDFCTEDQFWINGGPMPEDHE